MADVGDDDESDTRAVSVRRKGSSLMFVVAPGDVVDQLGISYSR